MRMARMARWPSIQVPLALFWSATIQESESRSITACLRDTELSLTTTSTWGSRPTTLRSPSTRMGSPSEGMSQRLVIYSIPRLSRAGTAPRGTPKPAFFPHPPRSRDLPSRPRGGGCVRRPADHQCYLHRVVHLLEGCQGLAPSPRRRGLGQSLASEEGNRVQGRKVAEGQLVAHLETNLLGHVHGQRVVPSGSKGIGDLQVLVLVELAIERVLLGHPELDVVLRRHATTHVVVLRIRVRVLLFLVRVSGLHAQLEIAVVPAAPEVADAQPPGHLALHTAEQIPIVCSFGVPEDTLRDPSLEPHVERVLLRLG